MPKKLRVRTLMDSQDIKRSETMHESARQYFSDIFWSVWKRISSKNVFLVVSEILTLLVNIFTPDDKDSLSLKAGVSRN